MEIQSAQNLPFSVEVSRENTNKYARLIQTFLPIYFNENFFSPRYFTLRCQQTINCFQLMMWPPGIQRQLCPMTFSDQSAISAHYDIAHVRDHNRPQRPEHPDAKYPCGVCGRKFTHISNMRKHKRTVHGVGNVKTFQCDVCARVFKTNPHLRRHLSGVHGLGDVKMFPCDLCSYVAKQESDLKKHVRRVHRQ